MKLNIRSECLHYLKKQLPDISENKLRSGIIWRQVFLRRFEMPYLEIFVTTCCNLKCKNCSNLIPPLSDKHHIAFDDIRHSIEVLLSKIDCLYRIKIHGGEAFLHPQLCKIIEFLDSKSKIKSIRITTNGTLIPSDDILRHLAESKTVVQISDYSLQASKCVELIAKLKSFGVKCVWLQDQQWVDMGDCRQRETNRYDECKIKRCTSMYEGKIYVCSRAAIMAHNGFIADEGIDVNASKNELCRMLKKLYVGDYSSACLHCDGDTHFAHTVQVGEQDK